MSEVILEVCVHYRITQMSRHADAVRARRGTRKHRSKKGKKDHTVGLTRNWR